MLKRPKKKMLVKRSIRYTSAFATILTRSAMPNAIQEMTRILFLSYDLLGSKFSASSVGLSETETGIPLLRRLFFFMEAARNSRRTKLKKYNGANLPEFRMKRNEAAARFFYRAQNPSIHREGPIPRFRI